MSVPVSTNSCLFSGRFFNSRPSCFSRTTILTSLLFILAHQSNSHCSYKGILLICCGDKRINILCPRSGGKDSYSPISVLAVFPASVLTLSSGTTMSVFHSLHGTEIRLCSLHKLYTKCRSSNSSAPYRCASSNGL